MTSMKLEFKLYVYFRGYVIKEGNKTIFVGFRKCPQFQLILGWENAITTYLRLIFFVVLGEFFNLIVY
jgi:hypothetical protein